jgi:UDP-N-acetylglucosamine acyltransferase
VASSIHPSAVVDRRAELGDGVEIAPFVVLAGAVRLGDGCRVGPHCSLQGPLTLGPENRLQGHVSLGSAPQDLKFTGEETSLLIGARNDFREFSTFNRGTTTGGGRTSIGDENLFMAYSHVAHDCHVGNRTVFANAATLAGHVTVGDWAVVGAFSAVHQFCRVGEHAYIGGFSVIVTDVLPFARVVGARPMFVGINRIGMERRGYSSERVRRLESALKVLTRGRLATSSALERLRAEWGDDADVASLVAFVEGSERGFVRAIKKGSRGG